MYWWLRKLERKRIFDERKGLVDKVKRKEGEEEGKEIMKDKKLIENMEEGKRKEGEELRDIIGVVMIELDGEGKIKNGVLDEIEIG